jgi:hypothetical protein
MFCTMNPSTRSRRRTRADCLPMEPDPPVSPYNLHFQEERARLLGVECVLKVRRVKGNQQEQVKLPVGFASFRQLSFHIQARWKEAAEEKKQEYTDVYLSAKAQYKMEMALYHLSVGTMLKNTQMKRIKCAG